MKRWAVMLILSLLIVSSSRAAEKIWVRLDVNGIDGNRSVRLEESLSRSLNRIDVIVEDSSSFMLSGQVDIVDSITVDNIRGGETLITGDLTLSLIYTETGSTLGTEVFTSKGMGRNKEASVRKLYNKFKFDRDALTRLFEMAKKHYMAKLNEINKAIYEKGLGLHGNNKKQEALNVLCCIDPETSIYADADSLMTEIKNEIWAEIKARMEHAEKLAREQSIQDSLRVDSLKNERLKAEALAQARSDSLSILETRVKFYKDSIDNEEKDEELARLRSRLESYNEQVSQLHSEINQAKKISDSLDLELADAKTVWGATKNVFTGIKHSILGGPDDANEVAITYASNDDCPKTLVGRWKSEEYSLTLFNDGRFVMTAPHDPKRVAGVYNISDDDLLILNATEPDMGDKKSKQQLNYKLSDSDTLILKSGAGMNVVFQKS